MFSIITSSGVKKKKNLREISCLYTFIFHNYLWRKTKWKEKQRGKNMKWKMQKNRQCCHDSHLFLKAWPIQIFIIKLMPRSSFPFPVSDVHNNFWKREPFLFRLSILYCNFVQCWSNMCTKRIYSIFVLGLRSSNWNLIAFTR